MAKIISYKECEAKCQCAQCPYPNECKRAYEAVCIKCKAHCPCCVGPEKGFCNLCTEEDCDNRNQQYDPEAISYEG